MKSQEANAIPLREILEKYGHEPVRSYHGYLMYSSPFRNEETPSFMVNLHTNKWKDFGEDSSGGVADLVMRLERCDFHSAMRRIENIIRKTKCFDFWERNVLFPKTKRSFFRTPKHPLPCPFPLNFSLLIITKKFGNLAKNRYICIV